MSTQRARSIPFPPKGPGLRPPAGGFIVVEPPVVSRRKRAAFTVVELLVVIAIISVLIALLMPSLQRAKRQAAILASPVAYLGTDSRIHLTDPSGDLDTRLAVVDRRNTCPVCHVPPVWNPAGTKIAFRMMEMGQTHTAFIDPFSGEITKHRDGGRTMLNWLDSERYATVGMPGSDIEVRDVHTNAHLSTVQNRQVNVVFLAPAPPNAPAPYVAVVKRRGPGDGGGRQSLCSVVLLRKDMTRGKRVWEQPVSGQEALEGPRIDMMGEYVAWSARRGGNNRIIHVKHVNDPPAMAPTPIGDAFRSAYFCDWTEEGTLLANVTEDGANWMLAVFDRTGNLLRRMETDVRPAEGPVASWRKYGRR